MDSQNCLDVIVRFHDIQRLCELERAIFSLIAQSYRPLHIYLALQRFEPESIERLRAKIDLLLKIGGDVRFSVLNWTGAEPVDARSILANLGIQSAKGRFVAFLDYDDVLYPEAYALLIGRLRATDAAIAFGGICVKVCNVYAAFTYVKEKQFPFAGSGLIDLFRKNFCPIHSFVIDRTRVPSQLLFLDPLLNRNEDYDLLLRLCAQCHSDFSLIKTIIGDYYLKSDGSNTIKTQSSTTRQSIKAWERAESFMEARRGTTPISTAVLRRLDLHGAEPMTVRDLLTLTDTCDKLNGGSAVRTA